jgi:hypothetical protein
MERQRREPTTMAAVATFRVWAMRGLSLLLVACSGDDHPGPVGVESALPECPQLDHAPCDTLDARCQKRLLALAGCVYGVATTPRVPVRVVTEQQLIDDLNASREEPGADDTAELTHIERTFVDLRLLQAGELTEGGGSVAQIVANIDGVYQDAERGIALVDRGTARDDAEANALLLHEFVHALQDAEQGLNAWSGRYPPSVDSSLALRTVTEGQATYAQFRVLRAMTGRDVARVDWDRMLGSFRDQLVGDAFADPSPYFASITTFPYAYGAASAYEAWPDHAAQFADPPLTTLEVLSHDAGVHFLAPAALELEAPAPDSDFRFVDGDSLGAFQLALSAHQLGLEVDAALVLALAWRGDALWIYAGPNEQSVWMWMLELGDAQNARELAELADASDEIEATASGTRVLLLGGDERPPFVTDAGAAFLQP